MLHYRNMSLLKIAIALAFSAALSPINIRGSQAAEWGGIYAGGHVGIGTTEFDSVFDSSEIPQGLPDDAVFGRFFELDGGMPGVHFGLNQSIGSLIYGVEVDWTHFDISDRLFDPNDEGAGTTDSASVELNWLASLRGRAGFTSAQSLIYATAGIAWIDADYTARNADNNNVNQGSADLNGLGFVVGGGIEHALTSQIAIRLEGLYYGFDNKKSTEALNSDSDPGDFAKIEDLIVARLGVSYLLNGLPDGTSQSYDHIAWNGFYGGGHIGYGRVGFDGVFDSNEIERVIDIEDSVLGRFFDLDGVLGGIHVGYNLSMGRFVYGIEADWSYMDTSDRVFDPDTEPEGTDNATADLNWLASLRGRVGVGSAQTLFYATAGAAWVDADYTA